MPRLSVLMPVRDAESTIGLALRSSLRALPRDAEVAVLDDGSRDGTVRVIESVKDSRVRLHSLDRSEGVAAGLNRLLAETQSQFIARMDADDVVLPGRFSAQERRMSGRARVVFGGLVHFGAGVRVPRPTWPSAVSPETMRIALLIFNPVAHSTMFAERSAVEEVGGYRLTAAEDYDLWLRLAERGTALERVRRPVVAYRHHPAQVSAPLDWRDRALAEPLLREAHENLATSVLGVSAGDAEGFRAALSRAIDDSPAVNTRYLRRKARANGILGQP